MPGEYGLEGTGSGDRQARGEPWKSNRAPGLAADGGFPRQRETPQPWPRLGAAENRDRRVKVPARFVQGGRPEPNWRSKPNPGRLYLFLNFFYLSFIPLPYHI